MLPVFWSDYIVETDFIREIALTISTTNSIRATIKELIIKGLNLDGMTPDMIGDEQPLFGEELGLDSVDALELMVMMEKHFEVKIEGREIDPETFRSVATLAAFVELLQAERDKNSSA